MKKIVLIVPALMALAAVSCTKSEVLESNDGEIRFNVVANNATKADAIYCNNNKPSEFTVYAESSDGKTYINGDKITSPDDGNTWVNESGTRFWPNDLSLDFYAVVNGDITWNVEAEGTAPASIVDFEVPTDVAAQKDLLYAVKTGQEKVDDADEMDAVALNFRHALSQIVFNAKNTNANLYVEIKGVTVANVGGTNSFTYPSADTANNIEDHTGNGTADYEDGSWGVWNSLNEGDVEYAVALDAAVAVPGDDKVVDLTAANDSGSEFNSKAMMLLPQETQAWDIENGPAAPGDDTNHGSYFLVDCAIWNVAGDDFDENTDVQLWGENGATKELAIPVALKWEQGKKYIYTFVFGKGNGGYDPDPEDPDGPDPDPVLVPIDFEISVDDFVSGGTQEIESGIPGTQGE